MRTFSYLLILFCLPFFSQAQFTVKGTVKDGASNQPVIGATVAILHTAIAASTDTRGEFTLQSQNDFDSIVISSIGYKSKQIAVVNKSQEIIVLIYQTSTSLNAVEVLGVKQAQSITTLTDADLHRYSGLNLQDALNTVPGVNMQSRSPWGGQHIIIRGYYPSTDNGRTNSVNFGGLGYQLYINNIPITDATGLTLMDDIDFSNLGKVEVIKGPSPLYGSYIAGAVNLFTPKPTPNQTSIQEQALGGSYGLFRSNTSIQTSTDKTDLLINYGHQTYNGFRPNDGSKKDFANFAATFNVSNKQTVSAYFSYNHSYEQLAGEIDSADFYNRIPKSDSNYMNNHSRVDIESFRAGVTDKYQFNDHFGTQTTIFATGSTLDQYFAHGFNKNSNLSFGGRTAFTFQSATDKLGVDGTLGLSFLKTKQNAQGNFILPFINPPFSSSGGFDIPSDAQNYAMNYNIFTQWKFSLPSQVSITVGGSLNFIEFGTQNLLANGVIYLDNPTLVKSFKPVFTPNISLLKAFNDNVSVYASVAAGYAPPTISQMTSTDGTVNTDLQPEKAIQYEIGTKGSLGANKKLSYQLALFDLDVTNRLIQQSANSISFYSNAGEQRNLGVELYLSYFLINDKNAAISLLRPWLSYTYSDFKYIDFKNYGKSSAGGDTLLADYSGNKVAAVAPNVFNLGVDLGTKCGFYLSGTFKYVDKVPVTFDNQHSMKSYNLLSAKIGYMKKLGNHFSIDAFVGADNLLSHTYYNFIFVGQNIQELAQGSDPNVSGGGGDGYILPAPYHATVYGGATLKYSF